MTAPVLPHRGDCAGQRLEDSPLAGSRNGQAVVTRCLDCGAAATTWLREEDPYLVRRPVFMRAAGIARPGAAASRLLAHLETQRALATSRAEAREAEALRKAAGR